MSAVNKEQENQKDVDMEGKLLMKPSQLSVSMIVDALKYVKHTHEPFNKNAKTILSHVSAPFQQDNTGLLAQAQRENTFHRLFDELIRSWKESRENSKGVREFFLSGTLPYFMPSMDMLLALLFFSKVMNNQWPSMPLQTFQEDVLLFRGVRPVLSLDFQFLQKQEKKYWLDNVITSWTPSKEIAKVFALNGRGTLFVARIPQNTRFYYIPDDERYASNEQEILLPGGRFVIPEAEKQLESTKDSSGRVLVHYEPLDQIIQWPGFNANPVIRKKFNEDMETRVIQDWVTRIQIHERTTSGDVAFSLNLFFHLLHQACGYQMSDAYRRLFPYDPAQGYKSAEKGEGTLASLSIEETYRIVAQQWSAYEPYLFIVIVHVVDAFYDPKTLPFFISKPEIIEELRSWWGNLERQQFLILQYGTRFPAQLSFRSVFNHVLNRMIMRENAKIKAVIPSLELSQRMDLKTWITLFPTKQGAAATLYDLIPDSKIPFALLPGSLKTRIRKEYFVNRFVSLLEYPKKTVPEEEATRRFQFIIDTRAGLSPYRFAQAIFQSALEQQDLEELQRRKIPLPPPLLTVDTAKRKL